MAWGDSLTAGYASSFGTAYTPALQVYDGGIGGASIADAYAAQVASGDTYKGRIALIHDKANFDEPSVSAYVATVQDMVNYQTSGKFIVIGGIYSTDGSQEPGTDWYIMQTDINDALAALYPSNYLHVADLLADPSTRSDGVHLTSTARDTLLIPAIQRKVFELGYTGYLKQP